MRISDINTDNNTVNLSMVPAGAYDDRNGGYGKLHQRNINVLLLSSTTPDEMAESLELFFLYR